MAQVVSANRLADGIIVFLGEGHRWVENLQDAEVLAGKTEVQAALDKVAEVDVKGNKVVEVAAFDVEVTGGRIEPRHLRDKIRAAGPTVHRDHGKQALAG